VTSTHPPEQPAWGKLIQARREQQGRSVRQAALIADLSDAYWGQVERGYVTVRGEHRPITPSRRALLAIADSLRMTAKETAQVLTAAGHKGYVPGESKAPREAEVDLTGLSRRDVALLNAVADRFREKAAAAAVEEEAAAVTPLRKVASGRPKTPQPEREAAAERRAREASEANPDAPRPRGR
jgi:transcriptional regulator with XRE-family HTH domain